MINNNNENKPTINIYYSNAMDQAMFEEVLWGIEEENIPFLVEEKREKSSEELAYNACRKSKLGIGIGIGEDGKIVIHHNKMKPGQPLFKINLNTHNSQLRDLGANAARLVKGIALKQVTVES